MAVSFLINHTSPKARNRKSDFEGNAPSRADSDVPTLWYHDTAGMLYLDTAIIQLHGAAMAWNWDTLVELFGATMYNGKPEIARPSWRPMKQLHQLHGLDIFDSVGP